MSTPVAGGVAAPPATARWLPPRLRSARLFEGFALASVVANVLIVVTGGAVRLTDSGLGCPTWPRCGDGSLTPTRQYAIHGLIEFSNRMLTVALTVVAVVTLLLALAHRRERRLAALGFAGIIVQAVIGGITVLTDLNPWLVACHFLVSAAMIAVTLLLFARVRGGSAPAGAPAAATALVRATVAAAALTLVLGTVVTGSGPHAGDKVHGRVHRTGLNVASMAQLHADVVMVLIGLTVGLVALAYASRLPGYVRRATAVLLAVELAQGAVGYLQYFLDVPPLLVGLHMLGACLVWIAALRVLFSVSGTGQRPLSPSGVPTPEGASYPASPVHR